MKARAPAEVSGSLVFPQHDRSIISEDESQGRVLGTGVKP